MQSLEFELNKQSKQNQELEQKVAKLEKTKSILMKHLLLERNKVKRMEEDISILQRDNFEVDIDIRNLTEDESYEDANDEREDESDQEETTTEDSEHVIVKEEKIDDEEAIPDISSIGEEDSSEMESEEKRLEEEDNLDDLLESTMGDIENMTS